MLERRSLSVAPLRLHAELDAPQHGRSIIFFYIYDIWVADTHARISRGLISPNIMTVLFITVFEK